MWKVKIFKYDKLPSIILFKTKQEANDFANPYYGMQDVKQITISKEEKYGKI